jgi:hypothetical protein
MVGIASATYNIVLFLAVRLPGEKLIPGQKEQLISAIDRRA